MAIKIEELSESDKGRQVSYKGFRGAEYGTIEKWDKTHVYVQYNKHHDSIPTHPRNLTFVTKDLIEVKQ